MDMIEFNNYKENISVEAFVAIVSKDIFKELTAEEKCMLKNDITSSSVHFSFGLRIRNKYIYPYLEKNRFGGKVCKRLGPYGISAFGSSLTGVIDDGRQEIRSQRRV